MDEKVQKTYRSTLITEIIISAILSVYLGFLAGAYAYETNAIFFECILAIPERITSEPFKIWPVDWFYPLIFILLGAIVDLLCYHKYIRMKNSLIGREYGNSKWNTKLKKFYQQFLYDPKICGGKTKWLQKEAKSVCKKKHHKKEIVKQCKLNSQILSNEVYMSLNTRFIQRNLNMFIFGGSGQGKSRNIIKPNVMNGTCSYVVTDPSGEILQDCGGFLKKELGYVIKVLNITDMEHSLRYNPFAYVHDEDELNIMVEALIKNIEGEKTGGGGGNEKFWQLSTRQLLTGVCGLLYEAFDMEYRTLANVLKIIDMIDPKLKANNKNAKDEADKLFDAWHELHPDSYAVSQYRRFLMSSGETAGNIIISTSVLLSRFFGLKKVDNLMCRDEMKLEELGEKKCALFVITPQDESPYGFIASMLYTQLFDVLYRQGEKRMAEEGLTEPSLKEHVTFYLDEMANIGIIPGFPYKLSTMRKYNISACPVYQSMAQIKKQYKDDHEGIIGNCDAMIFLGGAEASTVKMLSEKLGKATIKSHSYTSNLTHGKSGGGSETHQNMGRELMTSSEIETMARSNELVFITGVNPFKANKYRYEKHPHYKYTGGSNKDYLYPLTTNFVLEPRTPEEIIATTIPTSRMLNGKQYPFITEKDKPATEAPTTSVKDNAQEPTNVANEHNTRTDASDLSKGINSMSAYGNTEEKFNQNVSVSGGEAPDIIPTYEFELGDYEVGNFDDD